MGVDATMVFAYRSSFGKPTEETLARWSWDLCDTIGAQHFFVKDGLPTAEYLPASRAWHAAFKAHPLYATWKRDRDTHEKIITDIGEAPQELRRAIDFTNQPSKWDYTDEDNKGIPPEVLHVPGKLYRGANGPILAREDEWLLEVSLWGRYYGKGYERGDILTYCAIAEWLERFQGVLRIWYGGDGEMYPFGPLERDDLKRHFYGPNGRDYYNHGETPGSFPTPKPCGLCVPGENRFRRHGWGNNYIAVNCGGCGKSFESRDNAKTWSEVKDS